MDVRDLDHQRYLRTTQQHEEARIKCTVELPVSLHQRLLSEGQGSADWIGLKIHALLKKEFPDL